MKKFYKILLLMVALAVPSFAPADVDPVNGAWKVKGDVHGFPVHVRCEFARRGDQLDGLCHDGDADGATHALSASGVQGDHVSWTYRRRFLFRVYDAQYDGVIDGASMKGVITVARQSGATYTGAFTAARQ